MTNTPGKTPASDKKDVQKLQRAIIDGLEDVKAQDIQVFDTEHVTALFERVIIASGTSNRQTKALAASVRDAVRDAGFAKPRIEGEENGEWIIVDCGAAVAHIMQPTIRQYYHLEELWGDKPVKLKLGAAAPATRKLAQAEPMVEDKPAAWKKPGVKSTGKPAGKLPGKAAPAKRAAAPSSPPDSSYIGRVGKTHDWTAARNATQTAGELPVAPVKPARKAASSAKPASAKKPVRTPAGSPTKAVVKAPAKKPAVKVIGKPAARKVAIKSAAVKKPLAKRPAARKTPAAGR
jgi:ribosome-associated protein